MEWYFMQMECKCQREFVLFSLRIFATEIVKKNIYFLLPGDN